MRKGARNYIGLIIGMMHKLAQRISQPGILNGAAYKSALAGK